MGTQLLERERDLEKLTASFTAASAGQGCLALISGEAGIGKTSFVEHFLAVQGRGALVLKGHCDAFFMPSPLAPLHDIARQFGGEQLRRQLEGGGQAALFSTFLDLLQNSAKPAVLLIEDIHWADEATLDLIRYLSRRIASLRVLVIATYRNDEIGQLLRRLLGNVAGSKALHRIELTRLSVDAVRTLADGKVSDVKALHRQTGGNPFFVSEIVAASGRGIPVTVRDAVLARADQLATPARDLLELIAVIGTRIEHRMLEQAVAKSPDGLAGCISLGMLQQESDGVGFRHELVRDAILEAIDPLRRRQLYRTALQAAVELIGAGRSDLARIAHFAEGADNGEAVVKYGVMAAEAATSLGAHRQAAAQYERVLRFAGDRPPAERASFLQNYADACATIDNLAEAINAYQEAIELWREMRDRLKEGEALTALAGPLVRSGQNAAAEAASDLAISVLKSLPSPPQLAAAYRMKAHLRMLDRDRSAAVKWGRKAIELAAQIGDNAVVAGGEMVVGSALLVTGDDRGRSHLDRCLELARANGFDSVVALAHLNIGSSYGEQYRFADAESALNTGIAFARSRDLDNAYHYMSAWLALTRLYQGRWSEAAELAAAAIAEPNLSAVSKIMALVALGRVRARRGDPGATQALDEALELASRTGTLQRLAPVHAARAELAWLASDHQRVVDEARAAYDLALRHRHRWHVGEFTYWRRLANDRVLVPKWAAHPFIVQIEGNWKRAAAEWRRLGCPYEEARALAEGDQAAQLRALEIFDMLGAAPAALALRRSMRAAGVNGIPRGHRASTRKNAFGLTSRELETLGAIARGLSNRGIAGEFGISAKTVDHHVSAILAKLGVATRAEAATMAHGQGLLA